MKFNWGHGLALGMALFMGYILYLVIWSFDIDHELETEDYYGKELKHQEQIDKTNNHLNLKDNLAIEQEEGFFRFVFPSAENIKGNITFYRPSGGDLDQIIPISTDSSGIQVVSTTSFSKGRYVIKTDWNAGGKSFYFEKNIVI